MQARDVVGHGDADARGRAVRIAGQMPQPAHRLANNAVAGTFGIRPVLAETRDADHDQPRIGVGKVRPAQSPALERSGFEILYHHVALAREVPHEVPALGPMQIDADQFLVAQDAGRIK